MKNRKIVPVFVLLWYFIHSHMLLMAQDPSRDEIKLEWLTGKLDEKSIGVSWGVPWEQGRVHKDHSFIIKNTRGERLPLQTWPMAYWPDGSIKWSGFATVSNEGTAQNLSLAFAGKNDTTTSFKPVAVVERDGYFQINTGIIQCVVPKSGSVILDSLIMGNTLLAEKGELKAIHQNGPDIEIGKQPETNEFVGKIDKVTLEQHGAVRAVFKIEGTHFSMEQDKKWLPFTVRLYFYSNQEDIKLVHTFIYNGDENHDFLKGLGISFSVPMREELHNRHIRFSSENGGIWSEPVKPLVGRRTLRFDGEFVYRDQVAGQRVPNQADFDSVGQYLINEWASWRDFKLYQGNNRGFTIQKRTNHQSNWIHSITGSRASGLVYTGDVSGGLAVGLKDFWQSYPSTLEVRDTRSSLAEIRVWLWSPESPAMDLRHYDTIAHSLEASYEDVQEGFSTPYGIARTSEMMLFPSLDVPENEKLVTLAEITNNPPLLVCTPEYYHQKRAFGFWSLPDFSHPVKAWIENQLDSALNFYKLEIEQRSWYGFWDYGDVMHAYDPFRHSWMYDVGGYAWANTELMPDMWLWYSFLRTGRHDVFKMAEAMTRHTGEVDVYHLGKYAGLGSRHNVSHWGCGAKEVRISQAPLKRFYYYLTTDERTGDLMHEVTLAANDAIGKINPLRLIEPPTQFPTHARIGPDWLALVGNWMTEWERTGDDTWKDKIITGVNSFADMPFGFFSGVSGAFGYDPENYKLYMLGDDRIGFSHLSVLMGGPEVAFELSEIMNDKNWNHLWLQYCELFGADEKKIKKVFGVNERFGRRGSHYARMPAYAAMINKDKKLAKQSWEQFLYPRFGGRGSIFAPIKVEPPLVLETIFEIPRVSTNNTAQWSLNAIQLLEFIGDYIPDLTPEEFFKE